MRLTIKEGTAAWRSFNFRPPDPIWAPAGVLERTRRKLAEENWRLSVWWSHCRMAGYDHETPGRWRIVEWMPEQMNWATIFYWEGPEGQYRHPDDADAIIRRVHRADRPIDEIDAENDRHNAQIDQKKRREHIKVLLEHYLDLKERDQGIRQTFGPGHIRRRQVKASDLDNTNHKKWLAAERMT
jgi:hypothetical protein